MDELTNNWWRTCICARITQHTLVARLAGSPSTFPPQPRKGKREKGGVESSHAVFPRLS